MKMALGDPVLYLGEINDSQHATWCRLIEAFDEGSARYRQFALFPAERSVPDQAQGFGVQVRLDAMELHRPRQWGACWLACIAASRQNASRIKGRCGGNACSEDLPSFRILLCA